MTQPLHVAVIGTGTMARTYASILQQRCDCVLRAVAGNTAAHTLRFAEEFGVAGYSDSQYDLLFARHPEVEAVVIATPEWVRDAPVEAAVRHRQHMLLEKPFATSMQQARRLEHLLATHEKVFEICHVLRHSPRFFAAFNAVRGGAVGNIRHIYARRHSNNVRVRRVLGNTDLAFWLPPHDIDLMRWLTEAEVTEVFARSRDRLQSADDYLIANLRFDNGVDAVLEVSWCTPPTSGVARSACFEVWGDQG
jgi:predicted dehydrogenase